MKFKIINSDQGHHYTHYVDAPDKQTAMDRFNASHYGRIIDCEEVKPSKEAQSDSIKALKLINEALNDGLTIEKGDPIHKQIIRILTPNP